jgi:hypothetical protein
MKCPSNDMKVWVFIARVEEIHARSLDKVFDSKEKTTNITEQEKSEHFVNLAGVDHSIGRIGS